MTTSLLNRKLEETMQKYRVTMHDNRGKEFNGTVSASSEDEAVARVRSALNRAKSKSRVYGVFYHVRTSEVK
jgi:hypothetical protein